MGWNSRRECERAGDPRRGGELEQDIPDRPDGHGPAGQRGHAVPGEKQGGGHRDHLQRLGPRIDFAAGPYGTFKAALIHYTQGLAFQLAGKGIRANTVSPGNTYFEGGVWHRIKEGNTALYDMALGLNPTGRMGTPQEMANAVTFLASPAASFITGTNLVVDGALTRGVQF